MPYFLPSVHNEEERIYIRTNEEASNYKVVTLDLADKAARFTEFVPEDKQAPLEDFAAVNSGNFVAVYKRDVSLELLIRLVFS